MHAITLIQTQLNGIHQLFHECADDLTEAEWTKPVLLQTNLLGFTLWHMVRTRDWAVQTAIRGVPEVIADERWAGWSGLAHAGIGAGISLNQAKEIAHLASRTDVLAYADTVHSTIGNWLSRLSDDDLDTVPEMEAHMATYSAYQQPDFRAEIAGLFGQPIWRLLSGPCSGHQREHLGELNLLKQILRGSLGRA
ncbi:MAG TPA: DinB family protein [Ktedonobacteraceae bacterium]